MFWRAHSPPREDGSRDAVGGRVERRGSGARHRCHRYCISPIRPMAACRSRPGVRLSILKVLPWLEEEPVAGIHSIHGAASGNGWERPGRESGELLNLSRRTRLVLRVPIHRAAETARLCGQRLDIDGCVLAVGAWQPRPLKPADTLFARYVVTRRTKMKSTSSSASRRSSKRARSPCASSCAGARTGSNRSTAYRLPAAC